MVGADWFVRTGNSNIVILVASRKNPSTYPCQTTGHCSGSGLRSNPNNSLTSWGEITWSSFHISWSMYRHAWKSEGKRQRGLIRRHSCGLRECGVVSWDSEHICHLGAAPSRLGEIRKNRSYASNSLYKRQMQRKPTLGRLKAERLS